MATRGTDTVLVFGAGQGQLPYLRDFRARGWRVVAVDRDAKAPGAVEADLLLTVSTHDDVAIRERLEAENQTDRIAAVSCPTTGWAYVSAARIAAWLGLRFPTEEAVLAILDKFCLWQKQNEIGLTKRKCQALPPEADATIPLPAVVKPRLLGGASQGVIRCDNLLSLRDALPRAASLSRDGQALVESFLPGEEFKLAGFLQHGKVPIAALARRCFGPGTPGVPIGLAIGPAEDGRDEHFVQPMIEHLLCYCRHIGLDSTAFNVDFIRDGDQAELIDFDIVLGSFRILLAKVFGVDTLAYQSQLCLGAVLPPVSLYRCGAAVTYLWCSAGTGGMGTLLETCREAALEGEFIPDSLFEVDSKHASLPVRIGAFISEGNTLEAAARNGYAWLERVQSILKAAGSEISVVFPLDSCWNTSISR